MRLKGFKCSVFLIPCDFLHAVCSYFQYLSTQVEHVPFLSPCAFQTTKLLYDCGFDVDISFSKML